MLMKNQMWWWLKIMNEKNKNMNQHENKEIMNNEWKKEK